MVRGCTGTVLFVSLRVVVMGVSGAGKSTVAALLARRLGLDLADADEFHPPANVAKLAAGTPLTDEDRWPWLEAIARWLDEHRKSGGIVTCSALKRAYRDVLRSGDADAWFLHLEGPPEVISERLDGGPDRSTPSSLLKSQLDALEPPGHDERAITLDASLRPEEIIDDFLVQVVRKAAGPGGADGAEGASLRERS
jgi:gluconokinase